MKFKIILSTVPSKSVGIKIAKEILAKKLCACVNIVPVISSYYWWEGKVNSSKESLLVIKTSQSKEKNLINKIKNLHPYDVPEIICANIQSGWKPYLDWIQSSLK